MRPKPAQPPDEPMSREREQLATMLALMLITVFGGAFVLFLIFVSLGLFLWVLVISACIAVFSGLHYLAWGRKSQSAAGARKRDDSEDEPISDHWPQELLSRRKRHSDK